MFKNLAHDSPLEIGIFILGKLAMLLAVYIAFKLGPLAGEMTQARELVMARLDKVTGPDGSDNSSKSSNTHKLVPIIEQRNIFGVDKDIAPSKQEEEEVEPSELKMRLVGCHMSPESNFAIVEDKKKKTQDVFEIDENVFERAILKKIYPEKIELLFQGEIVTLKIDDDAASSGTDTVSIEEGGDSIDISVDANIVEEALENLPRTLTQARAVPFFRNSKNIGMRIFAIRKGSVYEKIGIKNGDIIKSVDGEDVTTQAQGLKLFNQLKDSDSVSAVFERAGKDVKMNFSIR